MRLHSPRYCALSKPCFGGGQGPSGARGAQPHFGSFVACVKSAYVDVYVCSCIDSVFSFNTLFFKGQAVNGTSKVTLLYLVWCTEAVSKVWRFRWFHQIEAEISVQIECWHAFSCFIILLLCKAHADRKADIQK